MRTKIIKEDDQIIVVYKPAGIAVETASIRQTDVVSELKSYLATKGESNPYLGIVHRLDQPVEGLLVFAKTPFAAAELSKQISQGKVQKQYLAAVFLEDESIDEGSRGQLVDYLVKDFKNNCSRVSPKEEKGAKRASLSYEVLQTRDKIGLLRIRLETGRHHQIRVQLSHAGMPLLGDLKYGLDGAKEFSKDQGIQDVALCACDLTFIHPKTKKTDRYSIKPKKEIFQKMFGDFSTH